VSGFFQTVLRFFLGLGYLGPFVLGIFDSSFLFLPFGNDLLVVAMTARHHQKYLLYALSAALGSTLGAFLLDLVARKIGEAGVTRVVGERQFSNLKRKISEHGAKALVTGCLAPPPFPFTMVVACNSALGYPRRRLLAIVAVSRFLRFVVLGALAIKFGSAITLMIASPAFRYFMYAFTAFCLLGSAFSIAKWARRSRSGPQPSPQEGAAQA
jgi:membrane protein YqaA with SNARE-associated domain